MPKIRMIISHRIGHVPRSEEKDFENVRQLRVEMESVLYALLHKNPGTDVLISSERE